MFEIQFKTSNHSLCTMRLCRSKRNVATVHGPFSLNVYALTFHCRTTIRCQLGGAEVAIPWCVCIEGKTILLADVFADRFDCGGVTAVVETFVRWPLRLRRCDCCGWSLASMVFHLSLSLSLSLSLLYIFKKISSHALFFPVLGNHTPFLICFPCSLFLIRALAIDAKST